MSERSIQYHYLKDNGIILFSIEKDFIKKHLSFTRLSKEDVLQNRRILYSLYSKEAMYKRILEMVNTLDS